jgi:predicted AAA+ superfamily ATPase
VVNVEERPLRSFEEDALAVRGQIVQDLRYVRGDRRNVLRRLQRIIERFREIDRLRPKIVFQQEIVVVENLAELGRKLLAQEQVGHPQRTPGNLVFIRRPYAPAGV